MVILFALSSKSTFLPSFVILEQDSKHLSFANQN